MIELSATLVIVAATVIVSLLAFNDRELSYNLSFSPYSVKHQKKWWQVFTHGFVHADYMHLALNMYVLYSFGQLVEITFIYYFGVVNGITYFVGLYIGGLLFATLPALRKQSENPSYLAVGASGAVSAVVFASIVLQPTGGMGIILIPIRIPSFIFGVIYLLAEHYMNKKGGSRIAHDAHIGGAIFGVIYLLFVDYHFYLQFIEDINIWVGSKFG